MRRREPSPFWIDSQSDPPAGNTVSVWGPWSVLTLMAFVFGAVFARLSIVRHSAFQSHAFDLGNMDQAMWSNLHGNLLRFTDMDVAGSVLTSRLAIHVEPFLLVLTPFYAVHGGPGTLLVVQSLVVALGAIPAYLLGRLALGRAWLSLIFPAAYLLHPSIQNAVLDDFHSVTMSASFLMWVIYFAYRGSVVGFTVFGLLSASTKEEVSLLVATSALFFLFRGRSQVTLAGLFFGIAWFAICVIAIIPSFNPSGQSPYLSRYAYLGHGISGVILGAIRDPGRVAHVLLSTARLDYLIDLLHPLGYVSLAAFPVFLLALPVLSINMLSSDGTMYSGFYQYSAEVVPFAVGSAAIGIGLFGRLASSNAASRSNLMVPILCGLVGIAAATDTWKYGFSPIARGYAIPSETAPTATLRRILQAIPPGAVVAAADEIEPHLAERRWIYLLPTVHPKNGPAARFVVLDASIPSRPTTPGVLRSLVARSVARGYGVAQARDGVLLLQRGRKQRRLPAAFYSFIFRHPILKARAHVRWHDLRLVGWTIHPKNSLVNRSRPAVQIDTFWRVTRRLPARVRIAFYSSPVYGDRPAVSWKHWTVSRDSPTWDWLPLSMWPRGRIVSASSLPFVEPTNRDGFVDVGVSVTGLGPPVSGATGRILPGSAAIIRLGTVSVQR
ncbi:MAG: hypothetical protein NVSMB52_00620 [Chloroflexota bacterium]